VPGRRHHPAAVQQHQSIAGAQVAQVDRRIVAARVVEIACSARLLELHVAGLGQAIGTDRRRRPDPVAAIRSSFNTVTGSAPVGFAPGSGSRHDDDLGFRLS
jgi:hypothetical protein